MGWGISARRRAGPSRGGEVEEEGVACSRWAPPRPRRHQFSALLQPQAACPYSRRLFHPQPPSVIDPPSSPVLLSSSHSHPPTRAHHVASPVRAHLPHHPHLLPSSLCPRLPHRHSSPAVRRVLAQAFHRPLEAHPHRQVRPLLYPALLVAHRSALSRASHIGGTDDFNVVFVGAGNIMFGALCTAPAIASPPRVLTPLVCVCVQWKKRLLELDPTRVLPKRTGLPP